MKRRADVVVIGGGSTGTAIAWRLAERGARRIVLLERAEIAGGGTGRSCAIVRTHYTHGALARLALDCQHVFERFDEIVGGPSGYRQVGWLALLGPVDAEQVAANVEMQRAVGIDARFMTPEELARTFPHMNVEDIGAGAFEPVSGYADPALTATSFADAARRHSCEIISGARVLSVTPHATGGYAVSAGPDTWDADVVVVAAGAESVPLLRPLGVELAIVPIWHSIGVVRSAQPAGSALPTVSDRLVGTYYRALDDHHALVGATGPLDGLEDWDFTREHTPRESAIESGLRNFEHRFPGWAPMQLVRSYTGVYDCTPDVQPLIGEIESRPGLFVAAGFSGHGFKLAPAIGDLVADLVLDGQAAFDDAAMFAPDRFAREEAIVAAHPYSVPTLG